MFTKLLVPLDGSELAERALDSAFTLAQQSEGSLVLLRVAVPQLSPATATPIYGDYGLTLPMQSAAEAETEAETYLKQLRADRAPRGLAVWLEIAQGQVAESIVDRSTALGVDLIVMSSHGYSGLTRWMLGSVAEKVLRAAPAPVLILRSPQPIRRILIPLDGSLLSEQVLSPALAMAASLGAEVTLLRAVHTITSEDIARLDAVEHGLGQRVVEDLHLEAERYLTGLTEKFAPDLKLKTVVVDEPAATGILDYAEAREMDLIAMSTHGLTGLQRWIYGSVTEKVLHGAHYSMLVVRPPSLA